MESLKKALAMVRQAHKKQTEKSGNTNYFAILLCAGTLIFGSSKVGGLNISTDSQKETESRVTILEVKQVNDKEDICEIKQDVSDVKKAIKNLRKDQVLANEKMLSEIRKITEPRGLRYAR